MDKTENILRDEMFETKFHSEIFSYHISEYDMKIIEDWIENLDWELEDFITFAQSIGVEHIHNLSWERNSFDCVVKHDTKMTLSLLSPSDTKSDYSEIWIKNYNQDTQIVYKCKTNGDMRTGTAIIYERNIDIHGGNSLLSKINDSCCYIFKLTIPDHFGHSGTHQLFIKIDDAKLEPLDVSDTNNMLKDYLLIEKYLLSLEHKHFVLAHVYERFMGLFGFINENYSRTISFSYMDKNANTLSTIKKVEGKMQEYSIYENGATYHVWKNGDWEYNSYHGVKINYLKSTDQYVSCIDSHNMSNVIDNENFTKALIPIKEKIEHLMHYAFD